MVRQKLLELELSGPMAHSGEQCLFLRAAFRSEGKRQHWPRRSFCDYLPYFEHLWRPMPPFGSHSAHGSIARASAIIPPSNSSVRRQGLPTLRVLAADQVNHSSANVFGLDTLWRSEERRVGKDCGSTCESRWSP